MKSSAVVQEKNPPFLGQAIACPPGIELEYTVLDSSNRELIMDTAECLAETFAGVDVDGTRVSEPMVNACSLSKEDMLEFVTAYLNNVVDQGLCFVAVDSNTGRVTGAVACEDFNPEDEVPEFEGSLEPMNKIIAFLLALDEKFMNAIIHKTGRKVVKGEYIHAFMAGARLSKYKRVVIANLVELIKREAMQRGYKGIFAEATNLRSARLLTDLSGFHPVLDVENKLVLKEYSEDKTFKNIPKDIATDCRILYKPVLPQYDI